MTVEKYAVILNGVVDSHALATPEVAAEREGWVLAGDSRIWDLWDGHAFHAPPVPSPPVPEIVEAWQAKRALVAFGHYALVEGAINALGDDPDSLAIKVDWASAKTFRRDWQALVALAAQLDLDSNDLDALFVHAATL